MAQASTTPPSGEVTNQSSGMSEDDAAQELLRRWGNDGDSDGNDAGSADDDAGDAAGDEASDEDTTSEHDDAPTGDSDESGDYEIDVAGEKFKLPANLKEIGERVQAKAKEVEAGATRRFQEAADLRKAAELTATQAIQQQQFNAAQGQLLGDHALVVRELQRIEQLDTRELSDGDLARVNHRHNQLKSAKERIEAAHRNALELFTADQTKVKGAKVQAVHEFAKAAIKDWTSGGEKRLQEYATRAGIASDELFEFAIRNPRLLKVLDDAEFGARIRSGRPLTDKRVPPKTTAIKPGVGGRPQTTAVARADQAMTRLKKSGNVNDAAAALLARSNTRKR